MFFFLHIFWVAIDLILFKLACNEDMHGIFNEFKLQPDWTTEKELAALEGQKSVN